MALVAITSYRSTSRLIVDAFSSRHSAFVKTVGIAQRRTYRASSVLRMKLQTAIVGLPNVGKSTLFNALTETQSAEAANYPFCTSVGRACGVDPRITF